MIPQIFDWRSVLALPGIALGFTGTALAAVATVSAESLSGLMITGAGAAVTMYGIYAYGRERLAIRLRDRIDQLVEQNEKLKVELYHLRAVRDHCVKHHRPGDCPGEPSDVDRP